MKIAIVGMGGMGGVHFDAYQKIEDAEIVAVCDVREEIAKEKIGEYNAKIYIDLDEMLANEKLEMIDICTPSFLHKEHVIKALDYGAHVFCEKPMALNYEDTEEIMKKVEETGKLYMVGHVVRFMKEYEYLKEVIDTKKYGKLLRLDMKRLSSVPKWSWENWFFDEDKSGLATLDLMIHDVDYIQDVFGMPNDICGVRFEQRNSNDYTAATYIYDDFTVSVEAAFYDNGFPFTPEFYAAFENGYLIFKSAKLRECGKEVNFEEVATNQNTGINISNVSGHFKEISYFMDCIKTGKKPERVLPESSQQSIELIEKTKKALTHI